MLKLGARAACRSRYEREVLRQTDVYAGWIVEQDMKEISGRQVTGGPLITVVPYYKNTVWTQDYPSVEYLDDAIDPLDFASMKGELVVYVHGDGELEQRAISTFCNMLNYDLIYCDEDCALSENNMRLAPFFKPDASPDTLLDVFYFGDIFAVRRELAKTIPVMTTGDVAERLYDFALKMVEKTSKIAHIPEILYHKHINEEENKKTYAIDMISKESSKICNIRQEAFSRRGVLAAADHDAKPLVSIIILSKDHLDVLKMCTESIKIKSRYNRIEIIIVDNGSRQEIRQELEIYTKENGYRYLYEKMDFNYSVMCNIGVSKANGEYLLFLNDDIEAADGDFIEKMLTYAIMPHVGAVGAKLLYPSSDIIQHVGITSLRCGPSHKLATFPDSEDHYFGRNRYNYDVLAVTGACMMISREKYFQVGGFSDKMGVSYNDVDLCISLYEKGWYNVVCNNTMLYHHESLSRGTDVVSDEKYARLIQERRLFYERHAWLKDGDPFYNVNLIQDTLEYRPNVEWDYSRFGYYNLCERIPAEHCRDTFGNICHRICEGRSDKDYQMTIEKTEFVRGYDGESEDFYCFEGWSLHMNRDNACLRRSLLLIAPDGEIVRAEVSDKYREDVPRVFPKARNSALAGFVCRIRKKYLTQGTIYRTAMLAESQTTPAKYIDLGEQYEPTGK